MEAQSSLKSLKHIAAFRVVCGVSTSDIQQGNEVLEAQLREARAAIADRDRQIAQLKADVEILKATIEKMLGKKSGGLTVPVAQQLLFAEPTKAAEPAADTAESDDGSAVVADVSVPVAAKKGTPRTPRKVDTTGLPRNDKLHDVPPEKRIDPTTGKPLVLVGETVFEEIEYQRAQMSVTRHIRPMYGLPPEEAKQRVVAPVMADMPPRPLEKCAASATLLAWLLVQKFANHLPLYRQEQIFGRDGKRLPRQTLSDWTLASAEALRPIVDCLLRQICSSVVLQLDDTPVMCQAGQGQPNFQACLWTFVSPQVPGVAYRFTAGRASQLLADEISGFSGTLIGDGYSGNSAAANKVAGKIVIGGCWAHVTRKFRDAEKEAPGTATLFREDIKKLYAVEREADAAQLNRQGRVALRRTKARPILAMIFARIRAQKDQFNDAGAMAKAIGYVRRQRKALRQFLREGLAPIDNNACERAIRPIAIGRRNWLFAGSVRGGRATAVIYSLIECCRLANVDMVSYFADVLVRVAPHPANNVHELPPANWAVKFAPLVAQSADA